MNKSQQLSQINTSIKLPVCNTVSDQRWNAADLKLEGAKASSQTVENNVAGKAYGVRNTAVQ